MSEMFQNNVTITIWGIAETANAIADATIEMMLEAGWSLQNRVNNPELPARIVLIFAIQPQGGAQ